MSGETYELRQNGVTVCVSSMPLLGYSASQIKRMEKDPARLQAQYELGRRDAEAALEKIEAFMNQ